MIEHTAKCFAPEHSKRSTGESVQTLTVHAISPLEGNEHVTAAESLCAAPNNVSCLEGPLFFVRWPIHKSIEVMPDRTRFNGSPHVHALVKKLHVDRHRFLVAFRFAVGVLLRTYVSNTKDAPPRSASR